MKTKDPIEAKKLAALKAVEFDDLVEQHRNGLVSDALETNSASKERTNRLTPAIDPQSFYHQIRLKEDQRRSDVLRRFVLMLIVSSKGNTLPIPTVRIITNYPKKGIGTGCCRIALKSEPRRLLALSSQLIIGVCC